MTQEQIDKECDAIVKQFDFLPWGYATETQYERICTKCAILHQTGIVEMLESVDHGFGAVIIELRKAKQILETLKSRVK
jgi:hypothetical protein